MKHKTCGCQGACSGASPDDQAVTTPFRAREMDRREFMATAAAGAGLAAAAAGLPIVAGPFERQAGVDHFVPVDKKLSPAWIDALYDRGESTWYQGGDLDTIGMPVGGLCAGQVYLTGDGRLVCWDIFNQSQNTGYGAVNYAVGRAAGETVAGGKIVPSVTVDQGFALLVEAGGRGARRTLDHFGFPDVRFSGEYPLGRVEYSDPSFPVEVHLEAFSPFIPLNAADSALPAIVLEYTVRNRSGVRVSAALSGWLDNVVCLHSAERFGDRLVRRNERLADNLLTGVVAGARALPVPERTGQPPIVFADFEGGHYGAWSADGEAFGTAPAGGTLADQQSVSGFQGKGLVNTFLGGDAPRGTLRSPRFTIERPYISFLVGGGRHEGRTSANLIVDDQIVRTATGNNRERLEPHNWNVGDLVGRQARIEIVDAESGGWGHVNVDQIEFRDSPLVVDPGPLETWTDYGTMCLAHVPLERIQPEWVRVHDWPAAATSPVTTVNLGDRPLGEPSMVAVTRRFTLDPGSEQRLVFVLTWHMPNLRREDATVGHHYAGRFSDAADVAGYVARNIHPLTENTRLWHRTYYDSTLPHWLLDRVHSTVANLATTTAQRWRNGRFWGWEGAGCCHGTCGHVWNYAHAMARLFPELERTVREMQDFAPGIGFFLDTGAIGFRGEGWRLWAGDAQGGYVLKAYREHQTSRDGEFLRRVWPRVKQAMRFLIDQDANADGLIEGAQHQTYDENYYGANTMVGSLYLGALRAAEEMAREVGDTAFAAECRRIFEAGRDRSVATLFNGEYFVQKVDLQAHPDWQYADGCLADQLFGQGWAHQVGLRYLYPEANVRSALEAIWKYCWAPDVGPQNKAHTPERWFASPGEAGLFTCTWPRSPHLGPKSTRYRNEIWTGIEYQVAGHMAWEGMVTEALAICRGVHERYHPSKHNPWNEIECGDHYARAMASWSVLVGLSGFEHHGPLGRIGFAPRITPEDFRCAFTAAEGWGTLSQHREGNAQTNAITVRWGRLPLKEAFVDLPPGVGPVDTSVRLGDLQLECVSTQNGRQVTVALPPDTVVQSGMPGTTWERRLAGVDPEAVRRGRTLQVRLTW